MKYFPTIFLFIQTISALGQVDTSKIKITTKTYYEYTLKQSNCNGDYDYSEHIDNDSIYSDIKAISYPFIKTPDQTLNKFINDTIQKIMRVDEMKNPSPKLKWGYNCIEDKPAEYYTNYKINFINSRYLSLTISIDDLACCGANGSSHDNIALTFDLVNKKNMTTTDIFNKKSFSTAYKIFRQQFNSLTKDEIQLEKFNRSDTLAWVTNTPFALFADKIIFYTAISYGHGYNDEAITYEFNKYPDIFDKKFIATVQKK